ncbi:hypothetical protein CVD19_20075 [Bacillus sp. T33-2]|nr:hypothetical protein CVD19_20075 [Bacillus sp. T33-2]
MTEIHDRKLLKLYLKEHNLDILFNNEFQKQMRLYKVNKGECRLTGHQLQTFKQGNKKVMFTVSIIERNRKGLHKRF